MKRAIVQVVQELAPPGGIQVLVLELRRVLQPDFDVHVVSLEGTAVRLCATWPKVASLGTSLHGLDKPPPVHPKTVVKLARLFRELSPIAVHTHHIGPLLYGGLAARLAQVPRLVHTEHDVWHLSVPRQRRLQRMAMSVLRPHMVADGQMVADSLKSCLPVRRLTVIPNGIDTARFSPGDRLSARRRLGLAADAVLVGSAGRLEPVKGHDLLVDATAMLPPHVSVVVAGDGSCRSALLARARERGVSQRLRFLGHVDDVVTFYRALDLFCLPSRDEGVPLAIAEAQACGVRVIATDVGGVREVLAPRASRSVPAGDAQALARVISEMLAETKRVDPRPHMVMNFDLRRMAESYRSLLAA